MFFGFGLDLAEVREYQAEDDIRYMDWNVTARMNDPYVRQYHEDREITAWFLLDLSPSVDFGTVRVLEARCPGRLCGGDVASVDAAWQPGRRDLLRWTDAHVDSSAQRPYPGVAHD